jgi:transposase
MRSAISCASCFCRGSASIRSACRHSIDGLAFEALIADKAFDSNAIITELDARGVKVVISQHPRRTKPLAVDEEMYKWRHLIENFFGKLKEFKRIAMRADKTDQSFAAMIHLAAAVINSR